MPDAPVGDSLPRFDEEVPKPREMSFPISGSALEAIEEMRPRLVGAQELKDVLLIAVAVLRQANGRTIQFVDGQGNAAELPSLWQ